MVWSCRDVLLVFKTTSNQPNDVPKRFKGVQRHGEGAIDCEGDLFCRYKSVENLSVKVVRSYQLQSVWQGDSELMLFPIGLTSFLNLTTETIKQLSLNCLLPKNLITMNQNWGVAQENQSFAKLYHSPRRSYYT